MTTGWEVESAHAARALARVLEAGSQVGMDLDVAIAARAAVLDTVAGVFGDVVPWYRNLCPPREPPRIDVAEFDPVGAFALVLRRRSRAHLDRSPSQLLERGLPVDAITSAWATAGRHAILARRAWPDGAAAVLDGPQCWRVVAQVAALAEAVAVLDADLTAASPHRPDLAGVIGSAAGLRLAAREVLALADRAAPEHPAIPRRAAAGADGRAPHRLVPERTNRQPDLARAVGRFTALIDRAEFLTPDQVRGCAQVARNLAVLAAGEAVDPGGQSVRAELGALAQALQVVATEPRTEAALITAARPAALDLHLRDLNRDSRVALATPRTAPADPELATRVARRLPSLVASLDQKARSQVDARRWAVLDRREGEHPLYAIASLRDPGRELPLLGRLRDAAGAAAAVGQRVNPPHDGQVHLVGSREHAARSALRQAVADRLPAARPPAHPADPIHGSGGAYGNHPPSR